MRLQSLPFTLNNVDNLCKMSLIFIEEKRPHPIFIENNIDAVPFNHPSVDDWRNNRRGINYTDSINEFYFYGAVDDVWVKPNGELIISDVKATSKKSLIGLKHINMTTLKDINDKLKCISGYLENGFKVSNEVFLVYFNG